MELEETHDDETSEARPDQIIRKLAESEASRLLGTQATYAMPCTKAHDLSGNPVRECTHAMPCTKAPPP